MQHFDGDITQFEHFAVFSHVYIICRSGSWSEDDGGPGFIRQVQMAAYEICVKMGFENIVDGSPVAVGLIYIRFGFPERINNSRFPIAFNIIRGFCEAAGIDLFNFHCSFI